MPLDPGIAQMLAALEAMGRKTLPEGSPEEGRAAFRTLTVDLRQPESVIPVGAVEECMVPGATGELPARLYRPEGEGAHATVVFFHGGGFVIGDLDTHDNQCRALCRDVGAVVLSVAYRVAPEAPFPAAVEDCWAALRWAGEHVGELGGDPDRLALAGDSAGGNLAAVCAQLARDAGGPKIAAQLLVYPATDAVDAEDQRYRSRTDNAEGYFLTRADMEWFIDHYAADADRTDPRLSPLRAESLAGLPPAVVVTAEYDPLRDEGETYAHALEQAGVPVVLRRFDGLIHGFFDLGPFSPAAAEAVRESGRELRALLSHRVRPMRALQITQLTGPDSALELVELPDPEPTHLLTPGSGVVVEVEAAGVSFPEVLQTRGEYQVKPPLPFVPGSEVAGVVRSAPEDAGVGPGDRVAAFCVLGGFAEVAVAPSFLTFPLPDALDAAQGAALVLNYHTAWFALVRRGRLREGETVLVHGAAGGVGTASIQVARGVGARTIAVVSSEEKERVAREAGADEVVRSDGPWKDQAKELSGGGVDVVLDPVGGDRFTDSLRALREDGRLVVVGFTSGAIPEVRVNRLLLTNVDVVGAGWGAYVMGKPELNREIGARVGELAERGVVRPVVGARFGLQDAAEALRLIDGRGATGKVVLEVAARVS